MPNHLKDNEKNAKALYRKAYPRLNWDDLSQSKKNQWRLKAHAQDYQNAKK